MDGIHKLVGLDIGSSCVKGILAEYNSHTNELEVVSSKTLPSTGAPRGAINNITQVSQAIQGVMDALTPNVQDIVRIGIAVKDPDLEVLQHKLNMNRASPQKPISEDEIQHIIQKAYEVDLPPSKVIMHLEVLYYNLDHESRVINPIGMLATHLEVHFAIVLGKNITANNLYKCLDKVDLNTDEATLSSIACADAVILKEEREAGAILINVGHQTTDILIFTHGAPKHFTVVPLGSELITKDIAESLQILPRQAEELKVMHGSALVSGAPVDIHIPNLRGEAVKTISSTELAYIIQPRIEEIFLCVLEEINDLVGHSKLLGGIILTGGGAKLKHITTLAKHIFKLPIRIGSVADTLSGGCVAEALDPIFSTAVGLVINAQKRLEVPVHLRELPKKKGSGWFNTFFKKGIIGELLSADESDNDFIK